MNVALTGVTAKGYRCARVARPDGAFVPQHVAILMARPRQSGVVPKTSGVTMAESSLIGRSRPPRPGAERPVSYRLERSGHAFDLQQRLMGRAKQ